MLRSGTIGDAQVNLRWEKMRALESAGFCCVQFLFFVIALSVVGVSRAQPVIGFDEIHVASRRYVPPSQAAAQQIFRAEANLVEVYTIVRDDHGQPVPGLRKEDFQVFDEKNAQEISTFSVERAAGQGQAGTAEAVPRRFVVLLFDDSSFKDLAWSRDAAERFLQTGLMPGDRIALFSMSAGQVVSLTEDSARLLNALKKVSYRSVFIADKLGVIEDVVDYLALIPGRRSVVVASPSLPGSQEVVDEIIQHAIRGNVVVNLLSTTGVAFGGYDNTMAELAYGTGGEYFHNRNDLYTGFKSLASSPEVSYVLGFAPEAKPDGRYHRLKVQLKPTNHYSVQARPGYYATVPEQDRPRPERKIDRVVLADDVLANAPAQVTVLNDMLLSGDPVVWAVVHVDLTRLPFERKGGRRLQNLRFIAVLLNDRGTVVAGKEGLVDFSLKEPSFAELAKGGINALLMLVAPPGRYRLRAVMQVESSGAMTATTLPVEVLP